MASRPGENLTSDIVERLTIGSEPDDFEGVSLLELSNHLFKCTAVVGEMIENFRIGEMLRSMGLFAFSNPLGQDCIISIKPDDCVEGWRDMVEKTTHPTG